MLLKKLRLTIKANHAKPTPPIGPMLGQRGLNIKEFCTNFNTTTQSYIELTPIVSDLWIDSSNNISISIHGPTLHYIIKNFTINNNINSKTLYIISKYLKKYDKRYQEVDVIKIFKTILNICKCRNININ